MYVTETKNANQLTLAEIADKVGFDVPFVKKVLDEKGVKPVATWDKKGSRGRKPFLYDDLTGDGFAWAFKDSSPPKKRNRTGVPKVKVSAPRKEIAVLEGQLRIINHLLASVTRIEDMEEYLAQLQMAANVKLASFHVSSPSDNDDTDNDVDSDNDTITGNNNAPEIVITDEDDIDEIELVDNTEQADDDSEDDDDEIVEWEIDDDDDDDEIIEF